MLRRVIDRLILTCLSFYACSKSKHNYPSDIVIKEHVQLPLKLDSFTFTIVRNTSIITMNDLSEIRAYAYYDMNQNRAFSYDYISREFSGSPFIRTFDYVENGMFTLISEVAVPPGFNSHYFINSRRVLPDTNNLVWFKFKSGTHNGRFKMTCIFIAKGEQKQRKEFVKYVDLIDSICYSKKHLVENGLWDDRIP
jgi:hypothetical protein